MGVKHFCIGWDVRILADWWDTKGADMRKMLRTKPKKAPSPPGPTRKAQGQRRATTPEAHSGDKGRRTGKADKLSIRQDRDPWQLRLSRRSRRNGYADAR